MYAICAEGLEGRLMNASATTKKSWEYLVWVGGEKRAIGGFDLLDVAARFGDFHVRQMDPAAGTVIGTGTGTEFASEMTRIGAA